MLNLTFKNKFKLLNRSKIGSKRMKVDLLALNLALIDNG